MANKVEILVFEGQNILESCEINAIAAYVLVQNDLSVLSVPGSMSTKEHSFLRITFSIVVVLNISEEVGEAESSQAAGSHVALELIFPQADNCTVTFSTRALSSNSGLAGPLVFKKVPCLLF